MHDWLQWPMSIVNNSLKLTISALALCFRERLTKVGKYNQCHSIHQLDLCLFYSSHTTNTLTGSLSTRFPTLIIVFKTQINSWLKTLTNSQRTFHTCILTSPNPLLIYSCSPISLVKQCKEGKYHKWVKPNLPSHSFSGSEAPFFMIGYFVLSGVVLRAFSPPFGRCMLLSSLHILHLYSKFIVLHYRHSNWAKVGRRL